MDGGEFHASVYEAVRQIPPGRVTSYRSYHDSGHIALLISMPRHARHVGNALKFLPEDTDVPWQRVIGASGQISSRGPGTTGAERQRAALEDEGVVVQEMRVNLNQFGWFPASL
ncbi:hypothetical protein BS47DRAFT_1287476 [Hydnum rufescens UP504]|uniref:Methylated-DNA-[protein]-cysteine S-methyltransferase DNA binding domain-containing protein n=1 Tax=Hydnum rufescens UP504 TaxID=1448309 RepID=A0A9P6B9C1_9AGAM|nr:hypothetical protein BS47DRAFT_1287476 [Hydnum rufescens UP504]